MLYIYIYYNVHDKRAEQTSELNIYQRPREVKHDKHPYEDTEFKWNHLGYLLKTIAHLAGRCACCVRVYRIRHKYRHRASTFGLQPLFRRFSSLVSTSASFQACKPFVAAKIRLSPFRRGVLSAWRCRFIAFMPPRRMWFFDLTARSHASPRVYLSQF